MANKILQDQNGKESGKRYAGFMMFIPGVLLLVALGVYSLFRVAADPDSVIASGKALILTGGGLLGLSVAEFFGKKIGKSKGEASE